MNLREKRSVLEDHPLVMSQRVAETSPHDRDHALWQFVAPSSATASLVPPLKHMEDPAMLQLLAFREVKPSVSDRRLQTEG